MDRYQEVMVALSDSVVKNRLKRHLADKSRWRHIQLAIKPRYLGNHASQIKCYYETLTGSHGRSFRIFHEISPGAPLAEKSRWRHTRLAIKPRYLANYASQMKSYYGSLSGIRARSLRIRHEKSREAPPSGWLTMTSSPFGNRTSLSRRSYTTDKSYYGSLSRSLWCLVIFI